MLLKRLLLIILVYPDKHMLTMNSEIVIPTSKRYVNLQTFLGFRSIICLEGKHVILHFLPRLRNINAFMKASRERRRRIF
nr:MAG TPA: hypothetical protein [Caudoviricetes sp.]